MAALLEPVPPLPPPPDPRFDDGGDEVSLGEYLDVLVRGRWIIAATAALALVAGLAYALLATPIYRADALVQVEDKKSGTGALSDLSALFTEASPAETEIEILRSRALVGAVVDELGLEIDAAPRWFPLIGGAVARRYSGEGPRGAVLGLGVFGWGGERITVGRLEVPPALEGETLTLEVRDGNRFALSGPDGLLLHGAAGVAASGGGVTVFVSELVARPGTQFRMVHRRRANVVAGLQERLRISEKGKKTGVLQLALEGADRARIGATLDALSRAYLRQNVERKNAEAAKTLEFLDAQLPELKISLEKAERELETYRAAKGSIDVTMEAQASVTRAVDIEKAISELKMEMAALQQRFTGDHPALAGAREKLQRLTTERERVEVAMRKLPEAELESARRLRDVKVANELYVLLLNRAQELRVVKEGTVGNVRILDAAMVPDVPVSPRRGAAVALSLLLGLALGVGLAFVRHALAGGVEDPEAVERATGIGVHASVPHSPAQARAAHAAERSGGRIPLLAHIDSKELAVESLRSLRTSLQFALLESTSNVVTVSGLAPQVGKSFVTANLGHLLGEAGKRVVVVDADLRRGHLHRYVGQERSPGLTEVLRGDVPLQASLLSTECDTVKCIATGVLPPNPAELLGSERFQRVIASLSENFDVVLIDTPPILAVADAAVVARLSGVNLLVLKAGQHPLREIAAGLKQLGRNGARVHGFVLNDVPLHVGFGRRNAYHYQYRYE
jgi:tyrosine-protein kinase Etk/Wzc